MSTAPLSLSVRKFAGLSLIGLLVLTIPATAEPFVAANVVKTIYSFKGGADGNAPISGLTLGPKNEFYGATTSTVFQLKEESNGKWSLTPIVATTYTAQIQSLVGTATALYGVTGIGTGKTCKSYDQGCGEVVELTPPTTGNTWKQKAIYQFKAGKDGALPAGIAIGPNGDIYGTTRVGGNASACGSDNGINDGCGTLFRLAYNKDKKIWTEIVLHAFKGGSDGALPFAAPSFDSAGNIYSSTNQGGGSNSSTAAHAIANESCDGYGSIFQYTRIGDYEELWHAVCDEHGPAYADAVVLPLINAKLDHPNSIANSVTSASGPPNANGAIFTTQGGGNANECAPLDNNGCGVVALLTAPASDKAPWKLKILHSFKSDEGALPNGNLVAHGDDTLYGVATYGGSNSSRCQTETFGQNGCGTLYELVKKSGDWTWGGAIYKFPGGSHGAGPNGALLYYKGKIYGTTADGGGTACGNAGCGTIFQLTP